jgi:hypothetical protein
MTTTCKDDPRRDAVRRKPGRVGLDFAEVASDGRTLRVHFLGKLPPELREDSASLPEHLSIAGGSRIRDLRIVDVDPHLDPEPDRDDVLVVRLDRRGDSSRYVLSLVGVEDVDPMYASVEVEFRLDCPSELDCAPPCESETPALREPEIDYLAKDYASFRRLILDRLSVLMPDWRERHVPDLGITLVELLAYAGDHLSYFQDAVATEAYLETARRRISVRRHARLVDATLHEGCNARAWVTLDVSEDLELAAGEVAFLTGADEGGRPEATVLGPERLSEIDPSSYERFEPVDRAAMLSLRAAHGAIRFYAWGRRECCLDEGATGATLLDAWSGDDNGRALRLEPGDVLILEEVRGPRTGLVGDADPAKRHAVRLTRVTPGVDPVYTAGGGGDGAAPRPIPVVEVEWSEADALPFSLCLSALGLAPECAWLDDVSLARGNVVLADHGATRPPEELGPVRAAPEEPCCLCEGRPDEVRRLAERFSPRLESRPLTFREAPPDRTTPATECLAQDPRAATPQVELLELRSDANVPWIPRPDLLASGPDDAHFVVEVDDERRGGLRFGDGECGRAVRAGQVFSARCRVGCGRAGNVGADSISRLVLERTALSGVSIRVRNPLPAAGGVDPEPVAEAKLRAPHAFRTRIERAVTAADYAEIAERHPHVQRAAAELVWTGSWYEADVALDPYERVARDEGRVDALLAEVASSLERVRRIGHDLHVERATEVPIDLALEACALPGHERGHVLAALLRTFGSGTLAGGSPAYFHRDRLTFGTPLRLSHIVATAQAVPGVECVRVVRLQRAFEGPNGEIEAGLLPLAPHEIARLDGDPDHPERGTLEIRVLGGR